MDDHEVENALRKLAARPIPKLSNAFEQDVWREIRFRKAEAPAEGFFAAFLRPGWTVSAAVVTLLVSAVFGVVQPSAPHGASVATDLAVFSVNAPALPSSLLFHEQ